MPTLIKTGARFSKAPRIGLESFRARKAIHSLVLVFKDREVYTPETSCMERTSFKNIRIKQAKTFGTFEKRAPRLMHRKGFWTGL